MAVATWVGGDGTGSEQTDYGRAANWSGGVVPDADAHVIVANTGHNCKLDANREAASLTVNSGATLDGSGAKLSIKSEGDSSEGTNGYAVNIDGIIAGNFDLEINTPAATNIDLKATSGNVRNVTINHASCSAAIADGFMTITGDLTITAGSLNTGGNDLTVTGDASVPGTLTGNASAISLGSLTINSGGTYSATSGTTTLTKDDTGQFLYETISGATFNNNDGTVLITGDGKLKPRAGTGNFHNLEINASGNTIDQSIALTCEGNLTITAGTLDTDSSNNYALTVGTNTDDGGATGHLLILDDGELVCNSSTVIVGSVYCQIAAGSNGTGFAELNLPDSSGSFTVRGPEKAAYVFRLDNQAECNHNGGTITFSLTAENHPSIMDVTSLRGTGVNNILVTQTVSSASSGGVLEFVGNDTVKGNLTLTGNGSQSCLVDTNFTGAGLTVDGDVTVNNHSTFINRTTNTGNYSFGSLTINSGGTYNATSGTTTITNKNSSNYMFFDAGTFTHNNGTVHFKADTSSGTWYAVKGHSTEDTTEFYNVTTERVGSSVGNYRVCVGGSNQFFTVRNNLTVAANCKIFSSNGSSKLRHSGLAIIDGELDLDSFTDIEMGAVTINSGGILEFDNGSITIKAESLRNVGGTINA